jgi:hypothetical protein
MYGTSNYGILPASYPLLSRGPSMLHAEKLMGKKVKSAKNVDERAS